MPVLSPERRLETPGLPPPPPVSGRGWGGDDGPDRRRSPVSKGRLAIWIALASITMMFAGLASAYLVMRGSPSWQAIALPSLLWANTLALLASSGSIEFTRRHLREGRMAESRRWMTITAALGAAFLAGQVLAWMQLNASGVTLASTLQSSFLYIFTATHGVHLAGGLVALAILWRQMLGQPRISSGSEAIDIFATYWHFMDGLWICLLLLLVLA